MDTLSIVIIAILAIALAVLAVVLFFKLLKWRYKRFISNHSLALKNLIEIKRKLYFYDVHPLVYEHSYDNENIYRDLYLRDYLIYVLDRNKAKYLKALELAAANRNQLASFNAHVAKKCDFGAFDIESHHRFPKYLHRIEEEIFYESFPSPNTEAVIEIILTLTNINGYPKATKSMIFHSDEIMPLIERIEDKNGYFYNDHEIYQSICKVERAKVTNKMRFAIYSRDGYRCCRCGSKYNLEIDHIIPIAKGGKTTFDNLQTLCHRCNVLKGDSLDY